PTPDISTLSLHDALPISGRRQLMTVSESQEIEIGREANKQVREDHGLYAEMPGLSAYVASVGRRIAAKSDRPGLKYEFEIVDTRSEEHTSELQSRSDLVC